MERPKKSRTTRAAPRKVRDREDALASTRDASATRIDKRDLIELLCAFGLNPFHVAHF
jgi:hypothetical protein